MSHMILTLDQIEAVTLGHAIADALGVPVEFQSRERLAAHPVTDMMGNGSHPVPAGCWSDDTSMAICALDVLAAGSCDFDRIMQNFAAWCYGAAYTATGKTFDVGMTCATAIMFHNAYKRPPLACGQTHEGANGNGSLMRIYPFVLYLLATEGEITPRGMDLIFDASALTHGHMRSKLGCGIYALVLEALLRDPSPAAVAAGLERARVLLAGNPEWSHYARILAPDFAAFPDSVIQSSGYVVHTLEAALWCLLTTDSYEACVLRAVNLGQDTDTVAAVAGSLAGALYGRDGIPQKWVRRLIKRDTLEGMCAAFAERYACPTH